MIEDVYPVGTEPARAEALHILQVAPLVDAFGRQLFVTFTRRKPKLSEKEEAKRRLLNIWLNQLSDRVIERSATLLDRPIARLFILKHILPIQQVVDPDGGGLMDWPMSTAELSDDSEPTLSDALIELQRYASERWQLELKSKNEVPPDLRPSNRSQRFNGENL